MVESISDVERACLARDTEAASFIKLMGHRSESESTRDGDRYFSRVDQIVSLDAMIRPIGYIEKRVGWVELDVSWDVK